MTRFGTSMSARHILAGEGPRVGRSPLKWHASWVQNAQDSSVSICCGREDEEIDTSTRGPG